MKTSTSEPEQVQRLHLPNCYNCIQAAIYQIEQGKSERAITFLKSAQKTLTLITLTMNRESKRCCGKPVKVVCRCWMCRCTNCNADWNYSRPDCWRCHWSCDSYKDAFRQNHPGESDERFVDMWGPSLSRSDRNG